MSPEAAHFHRLEYSEHSYPANGHLVGGQGAGLVRADDEVQPRVSTEGRERTMAFFLAMRRVPRARQVVMTAGRPSGMAATASATAILK